MALARLTPMRPEPRRGGKKDEVGLLGLDISHELVETPGRRCSAHYGYGRSSPDNLHVVGRCVLADDFKLVFR